LSEKVEFAELNWMDVAARLQSDTRVVIPLGATEEHGYLSLLTDTLFVNRVAGAACRRAGVLMTPAVPFGCSAFAVNYPGTLSLRTATMCRLVEDIIDCLYRQGFRRLIFATGHGGNEVITGLLSEAQLDRPGLVVYYKDAWAGMKDAVRSVEAEQHLSKTEHGAWHEAFAFSRTTEVPPLQKEVPSTPDYPAFPLNPRTARTHLGDGVVGGAYTIADDAKMEQLFAMCVAALTDFINSLPKTPADA
jgi:creatinine amidohydrolase